MTCKAVALCRTCAETSELQYFLPIHLDLFVLQQRLLHEHPTAPLIQCLPKALLHTVGQVAPKIKSLNSIQFAAHIVPTTKIQGCGRQVLISVQWH